MRRPVGESDSGRRSASTRYPSCWALGAALSALLALGASGAWAQDGRKQDEAGMLVVVLPALIAIGMSLHLAAMAAFPRFSYRCATAVRRFRWQTGLIGLAAYVAVLLVSAVFGSAAKGTPQAAAIPLLAGGLLAGIGGVGVSLEVGRWALERIHSDAPAHPVVAVLAGSALVGWATLVPCAGQLLWVVVACLGMGAFVRAAVQGTKLDEAPPRRAPGQPAAGPATLTPPPAAQPAAKPTPPAPEDSAPPPPQLPPSDPAF